MLLCGIKYSMLKVCYFRLELEMKLAVTIQSEFYDIFNLDNLCERAFPFI